MIEAHLFRVKWFGWLGYQSKVSWQKLSANPKAIHILEQHLDKVDWSGLSANPNAIHILAQNVDKIDWYFLSTNPNAVPIIEQHLDKVYWDFLSSNENGLHLLEQHPEKVDLSRLLLNKNPKAVHLYRDKIHLVNSFLFCSYTPHLDLFFDYDYPRMSYTRNRLIEKELNLYVFDPDRISSICTRYNTTFQDYVHTIS